MKRLHRAALRVALALPALLLTSCELDQFPESNLTNEEAWENFSDAQKQHIGLLSALRSVTGGANSYLTDLQADLFNARTGTSSFNDIHDWSFTPSQFSGDAIWANNFGLVLQANDMLSNINKFLPGLRESIRRIKEQEPLTDEQSRQLTKLVEDTLLIHQYRGEAHFARAYAYCNLVTRYCKDYEPATDEDGNANPFFDAAAPGEIRPAILPADKELGLPIVETVDKNARPARATLEETCAFISRDIEEARREWLDSCGGYTGEQDKPGYFALRALEARFQLYTHQYSEAIETAEELLEYYSVVDSRDALSKLWREDTGESEIIYQPKQTPDEQVTNYSIFLSYDIRYENMEPYINALNPFYVPTQGLVDLYETRDHRRTVYFNNKDVLVISNFGIPYTLSAQSASSEGAIIFTKFSGNPNLWKSSYFEVYNMSKAFRAAESYLIIAEAAYMHNNDETTARKYLNQLRQARGASKCEETGEAMLNVIRDEWTREFVGEGFRLDNLKRWHMGFTRMEAQHFSLPLLINVNGYQNLKVQADDKRFVWEIPEQDLQANPNLQRNW